MNKNENGYVICVTPTGSDLPFVPNVEHILIDKMPKRGSIVV